MANEAPPPPTRSGIKPVGITALVIAAATAIAPFTMHSEGTIHKAYQDPAGIWTICTGHTKGVKKGDVATDAQCTEMQRQDMEAAMTQAISYTPNLATNKQALEAVGDMTFNSGIGGYINSPVARAVKANDFVAACKAFPGWYTGATFDKPQKNLKCKPHPSKPGKFLCELNGLVKRRINESRICQGLPWIP